MEQKTTTTVGAAEAVAASSAPPSVEIKVSVEDSNHTSGGVPSVLSGEVGKQRLAPSVGAAEAVAASSAPPDAEIKVSVEDSNHTSGGVPSVPCGFQEMLDSYHQEALKQLETGSSQLSKNNGTCPNPHKAAQQHAGAVGLSGLQNAAEPQQTRQAPPSGVKPNQPLATHEEAKPDALLDSIVGAFAEHVNKKLPAPVAEEELLTSFPRARLIK